MTVVSLTAFRSLYGMRTNHQQEKDRKRYQWLASYRRNMLNRKKQPRVDEFGDAIPSKNGSLPSIPSATLSGLRSMIGRISAWPTQVLSTRETQEEEAGSVRINDDSGPHQNVKSFT